MAGLEQMLLEQVSTMTPGAKGIWFFGFVFLAGWSLKAVAEWRHWKKLPLEQKQANREGFAAQVELLQRQLNGSDEENRRTRAEISTLRAEYEQYRKICHDENDQLRKQVINLTGEVEGLRRKLVDLTLRALEQGIDLSDHE